MESIDAFIDRLPTVELHLHLVGSASVPTVLELARLLEQGLFVTLNSDDPPMFGTTLRKEYQRAAAAFGLDRQQLAALAANGVRASFLDSAAKQALIEEIEAVTSGADQPMA